MQYLARSETIARWSVYLLFALVPFFFVPLPWVSVAQSKTLLAALVVVAGFLAWITYSLKAETFRLPKSSLLVAGILVPLAYLVSALVTGASWESFAGDGRGQDTVVGFVLLYVAFLVSAGVLGGSRTIPAIRLLLGGSLVVLLVQVIHLAMPAITFGGVLTLPATSIVGSWHDLGIFLVLLVFVSLALMRTHVLQGYWRVIAVLVTLLCLALLVVINFGDVWLGLFALSFFYVFFLYLSRAPDAPFSLRTVAPWLLCAAIALGMYFGGNVVQANLPAQLQVTQIEVRPSWRGTFAIGEKVFAEPSQIFFGSGPNTFLREWGIHKPLSVNETQFWNTDFYYGVGFIPTSFVTTGIVGFIAWGAVCVALLWSLYRLFRRPSRGDSVRATLMGSALFLTTYHILYVPGPSLSLMTFLVFGALVGEELSQSAIREWIVPLVWETWKGKVASLILLLSGLAVLVGGIQTVRAIVSDTLVNHAVMEYNATRDFVKASRSISWAVGILPHNDRAHRAGVELGILQLSEFASQKDASESARTALQETLTSTIEHGLAAVSIESRNYQNWLTLARLYGELAGVGVEGAEARARDAYRAAQKNNPASPLAYVGEAHLDLIKGDDAAARGNLEAAIRVKSDLAVVHFLLSQIYARAGDYTKAREYAGAVVQIAPQDPLGWYNLGTIFYTEKNYRDAALSLERAVAIQDNYANALFLLGLSYYRLDRRDDALKSLKVVLVLNPEDVALTDLIKKIEAGEDIGPPFQ